MCMRCLHDAVRSGVHNTCNLPIHLLVSRMLGNVPRLRPALYAFSTKLFQFNKIRARLHTSVGEIRPSDSRRWTSVVASVNTPQRAIDTFPRGCRSMFGIEFQLRHESASRSLDGMIRRSRVPQRYLGILSRCLFPSVLDFVPAKSGQ